MITKDPAFFVFGAGTEIGKTIFSAGIAWAATKEQDLVSYIKAIQTGFPEDCDSRFLKQYVPSKLLSTKNIFAFPEAISPHRIMKVQHQQGQISPKEVDATIIQFIGKELQISQSKLNLIEGSGGAASPTFVGALQCDLFRSLRLPVILVADYRLGGISSTIATIELLENRGFDIVTLLCFEGEQENGEFFKNYYKQKFPVYISTNLLDKSKIKIWFHENTELLKSIYNHLLNYHQARQDTFDEIQEIAKKHIWWPFTQHKNVSKARIIDSAYEDDFTVLSIQDSQNSKVLSKSVFDASGSWWTNSIGHGSPQLALASAYAAGRYGHVMFPKNIHEPAALLAKKLIATVGFSWADRVFFSDNGSTAIEVALKMAFRKAFGLQKTQNPIILGLKNSYHGDTLAAMDSTNPNVFKMHDHWYQARGFWLDYPSIHLKDGKYSIHLPLSISIKNNVELKVNNINDIFSSNRYDSELVIIYEKYIKDQMIKMIHEGKTIGALIMEGVVQGACGMHFVDPLFQKVLTTEVQKYKIPVILDEVFTGIGRLGAWSTAHLLKIKPDLACYGKALSGGLLPFAVTLATEDVFSYFLGEHLSEALLHGHSYAGNPVACHVALTALENISNLFNNSQVNLEHEFVINHWSDDFAKKLSYLKNLTRVVNLGTLLAIEFCDNYSGYSSLCAQDVVYKMNQQGIDVRPLGNVAYFLSGYYTQPERLRSLENTILMVLTNEVSL